MGTTLKMYGECARIVPTLRTNYRRMATYAFLFPGQGSQYVGMTERLPDLPEIREIFSTAERILGYDLRALCIHGPQQALDQTVYSQPAVVAASLAAVEWIKQTRPELVRECVAAAGFSVGEITALVFSGAMSLGDGLHLIKVRAESMHAACLRAPGAMATISGLELEELKALCQEIQTSKGEVSVANHLYPRGYVVSGASPAVSSVKKFARRAGGAVTKDVATSGAFHSSLMSSVTPIMACALKSFQLSPPTLPVYSNVTGLAYRSTEEIRTQLTAQVTSPVMWEQTIMNITASRLGKPTFVELGPGCQLKAMLKRTDREFYNECISVEV